MALLTVEPHDTFAMRGTGLDVSSVVLALPDFSDDGRRERFLGEKDDQVWTHDKGRLRLALSVVFARTRPASIRAGRHFGGVNGALADRADAVGIGMPAGADDAQPFMEEFVVFAVLTNHEIAVPVVVAILVDVMNFSVWRQRLAERLLCYQTVLRNTVTPSVAAFCAVAREGIAAHRAVTFIAEPWNERPPAPIAIASPCFNTLPMPGAITRPAAEASDPRAVVLDAGNELIAARNAVAMGPIVASTPPDNVRRPDRSDDRTTQHESPRGNVGDPREVRELAGRLRQRPLRQRLMRLLMRLWREERS